MYIYAGYQYHKSKLTTSIADGMPTLISSPKGGNCCPAILTGNDDSRVSILRLKGIDVNWNGFILGFCPAVASALPLPNVELSRLGHAVVVRRAAVTALRAASAVAAATARTGARLSCIGGHIGCTSDVWQQLLRRIGA